MAKTPDIEANPNALPPLKPESERNPEYKQHTLPSLSSITGDQTHSYPPYSQFTRPQNLPSISDHLKARTAYGDTPPLGQYYRTETTNPPSNPYRHTPQNLLFSQPDIHRFPPYSTDTRSTWTSEPQPLPQHSSKPNLPSIYESTGYSSTTYNRDTTMQIPNTLPPHPQERTPFGDAHPPYPSYRQQTSRHWTTEAKPTYYSNPQPTFPDSSSYTAQYDPYDEPPRLTNHRHRTDSQAAFNTQALPRETNLSNLRDDERNKPVKQPPAKRKHLTRTRASEIDKVIIPIRNKYPPEERQNGPKKKDYTAEINSALNKHNIQPWEYQVRKDTLNKRETKKKKPSTPEPKESLPATYHTTYQPEYPGLHTTITTTYQDQHESYIMTPHEYPPTTTASPKNDNQTLFQAKK